MKEFITYGFFINPELIQQPKPEKENRVYYLNKPANSLWGSPVNSEWGWKDWCTAEDFRKWSLSIYTKWKLKPSAKILKINSFQDLQGAMDKYGFLDNRLEMFQAFYLDFHKIMKDGYHGVMLTLKGNSECHYDKPYKNGYISLNAWDCESITIWDKNQIVITEKGRI